MAERSARDTERKGNLARRPGACKFAKESYRDIFTGLPTRGNGDAQFTRVIKFQLQKRQVVRDVETSTREKAYEYLTNSRRTKLPRVLFDVPLLPGPVESFNYSRLTSTGN